MNIRNEDWIALYRGMVLTREFEMATIRIQAQKGLPENPGTGLFS